MIERQPVHLLFSKPQISLLLPAGHKIGKPIPLFTKIEQTTIDELKKKYAGVQQAKDAAPKVKPEKSKLFDNIEEAEKAVDEQGLKVRQLKGSGVEKAVWQPEVTILLELKKQLANLQAQKAGNIESKEVPKADAPKPAASENDVKKLEDEVAQQVRQHRMLNVQLLIYCVFRVKRFVSLKLVVLKKQSGNPRSNFFCL